MSFTYSVPDSEILDDSILGIGLCFLQNPQRLLLKKSSNLVTIALKNATGYAKTLHCVACESV